MGQGRSRPIAFKAGSVPVTLLSEIPEPPSYFSKDADKLWRETCKGLIDMRMLTSQSYVVVECYVNSVTKMRDMMTGRLSLPPSTQIAAIEAARKAAADLGLSPSAHARVRPLENTIKTDAEDVEKMLT